MAFGWAASESGNNRKFVGRSPIDCKDMCVKWLMTHGVAAHHFKTLESVVAKMHGEKEYCHVHKGPCCVRSAVENIDCMVMGSRVVPFRGSAMSAFTNKRPPA